MRRLGTGYTRAGRGCSRDTSGSESRRRGRFGGRCCCAICPNVLRGTSNTTGEDVQTLSSLLVHPRMPSSPSRYINTDANTLRIRVTLRGDTMGYQYFTLIIGESVKLTCFTQIRCVWRARRTSSLSVKHVHSARRFSCSKVSCACCSKLAKDGHEIRKSKKWRLTLQCSRTIPGHGKPVSILGGRKNTR